MGKLAKFKARADQLEEEAAGWAQEKKEASYVSALCSHFDDAEPRDLIRMWEIGHNLKGGKLTEFESVL